MQHQNWLRNLIDFKKLCPVLFGSNFFVIFVPFKNKEGFGEMFIDCIDQNLYAPHIDTNCWCKHNNNGNNTKKKLNNTLNIINLKRWTQNYLDWGTALALFKEIQALGWIIFVTGVDLFWLVSLKIQQPNKCCMTRTASAQSVQTQSSNKRTPFFGPKSIKYLEILLHSLSHRILFTFNYFLHSLLIWN